MDGLTTWILYSHISAGFIALLIGPFAMFSAKGKRLHRRSGLIYVWAMVAVVVSAIPLAVLRPNIFLLGIAVFSFYLTFSGYRALAHKRLHQGIGVTKLDWLVSGLTLCFSLGLIIFSIMQGFDPLPLIFGALGLFLVSSELRKYRGQVEKGAWLLAHIAGMLAAYIATFTAFAVTNIDFLPELIVWLTPTVIGTVAITWTIRHYKSKFSNNKISHRSSQSNLRLQE